MIRFGIFGDNENFKNTIEKKLNQNCVCLFDNTTFDIAIKINNSVYGPEFTFVDNSVIINLNNYDDQFVDNVVSSIFRNYKIDSLDFDFEVKTADSIEDNEIALRANYDKIGNTFSRGIDDPVISLETAKRAMNSFSLYTVRRSFLDSDSEKFVGESLSKAILECDKHAGFKVYDSEGKVIYSSHKNKIVINTNCETDDILNETAVIRTGNGLNVNGIHIPDGTRVIITKKSNKISEIKIHLGNETIITEILTSVLSKM